MENIEPGPAESGTPVSMSFSATSDAPDARTTLGDDLSIRWQSWDKITVFSGPNAAGSEFTVSSLGNDNKQANFTGLGLPAVDHYAVSPAQGATISDGVITAVLPMQQGVRTGSFGAQANLSAAVSDASSDEFYFRNVTGILSFKIADSGVTGVRLESLGDEKLSGETSITFSGDIPAAEPTTAAHSWVCLSGELSANTTYYFAVFPGEYNQGFRITLYKNGRYASTVSRTRLSLQRNGNVYLGAIPSLSNWKTPGTPTLRGESAEDGQLMSYAANQYADMNVSRNRGTQIEAFASDEYNYEAFTHLKAGEKLYFQDGGQLYGVFSGRVMPISSAAEAPAAEIDSDGTYRIRLNLPYGKAYFQKITAVECNRCGSTLGTLSYEGNGIWACRGLRLTGSDDRYKFHFTIDGQTQVYGRMYDTDKRPSASGLNPAPDTYFYVQPAKMDTWEPSFKFPDAYYTGDTGRYFGDLILRMNGAHYTHEITSIVDGDNLPDLEADEVLTIQGAGAAETGQRVRYSASFSSDSSYGDEDALAGPDGYDYEIFTKLLSGKPFYFETQAGAKFAFNAAGTELAKIATPENISYGGVTTDGVYRVRFNSSTRAVKFFRVESAQLRQPTYQNQYLEYSGNGTWTGRGLDLYWKPKPEWGANRQWQYNFQLYFNTASTWQYYGFRDESTPQPTKGFWDGLFSVADDATLNIYTTENQYVFAPVLQLNADGYNFNLHNGIESKPGTPDYRTLTVTSAEETFQMHLSANGDVFEGVSTFANGTTVNMVATDALGRKYNLSTTATVDGVAYFEANPATESYTFTALPSLLAEGNAVNGFSSSSGATLSYAGHGVFSGSNLTFAGSSEGNADAMTPTYPYSRWGRARFTFVKSGNGSFEFRRLNGSRMAIENRTHGSTDEMQINPGTYDIRVDLRNFTFDIRPAHNGSRRITVMGSSVPTGTGATDNKGYMYLFGTNALTSGWTLSNRSVPGNNTVSLTERYDDLIMDGGKYVVYALSLGNEGIHGAADQNAVYKQWKTNMQSLISRARNEGRKVVVTGNYGRGDFNASDYAKVKAINLEIHQWNVPSVNVLGAVDDEAGHWPSGYQNGDDTYHPNDAGHAEMSYTIVPSVFDAMEAKKPMPVRNTSGLIDLNSGSIGFTPEATVHPFTVAFYVKTAAGGNILHIGGTGLDRNYSASELGVNDGNWHLVAVTHYYAKGITRVYVDGVENSSASERIVADSFSISGASFRELFFWRSAMNPDEMAALAGGALLNSSLEIYAPFIGGALTNLAISTNTITY
ncbi:MAG: SGNH/GDSL hydrolase family protein [Bacteroidales bacterium]|nr:SGNH/GDSL hydrolase family protein [Bacteroidales bacterium]